MPLVKHIQMVAKRRVLPGTFGCLLFTYCELPISLECNNTGCIFLYLWLIIIIVDSICLYWVYGCSKYLNNLILTFLVIINIFYYYWEYLPVYDCTGSLTSWPCPWIVEYALLTSSPTSFVLFYANTHSELNISKLLVWFTQLLRILIFSKTLV